MRSKTDIKGERFGRLVVVKYVGKVENRLSWECLCDCGNTKTVFANNLRVGHTTSCGCRQRELASKRQTTHGATGTPEFEAWCSIHKRCNNPSNRAFASYGGRGISVCSRWSSFDNFLFDMGNKPTSLHSIDRINNDLGYAPDNCRWATYTTQNRNKRSNRILIIHGISKCVSDWAELSPVNAIAIFARLYDRWPDELAVFAPKYYRPKPSELLSA